MPGHPDCVKCCADVHCLTLLLVGTGANGLAVTQLDVRLPLAFTSGLTMVSDVTRIGLGA